MKWNEMTTRRKVLYVLANLCAVVTLILCLLDSMDVLQGTDALRHALFGLFFLYMGITNESRFLSIGNYVMAAAWFFLSFLYICT